MNVACRGKARNLQHRRPTTECDSLPLLQVLLTCVRCPGGDLLTHENVLSIFQACFRIGHYQTERSKDMSGSAASHCRPYVVVEVVSGA